MDRSTRKLLLFIISLFLIWLSWKLFIYVVGEEQTPVDQTIFPALTAQWKAFNDWYKIHLIHVCVSFLRMFGFPAQMIEINFFNIGGSGGVRVGNYCLGFQLMYYFTALVAVSEINFKGRIFGIIAGFIIVNVLNIIRLSSLALITVYKPNLVEFFHDQVFNVVVFGTLIAFYYFLLKRNRG